MKSSVSALPYIIVDLIVERLEVIQGRFFLPSAATLRSQVVLHSSHMSHYLLFRYVRQCTGVVLVDQLVVVVQDHFLALLPHFLRTQQRIAVEASLLLLLFHLLLVPLYSVCCVLITLELLLFR